MNLLKNKILYYLIIPFVLLLLISLSYYYYWSSNNQRINIPQSFHLDNLTDNINYKYLSKLTGEKVDTKQKETPTVVAITIDNHFNARQIGVNLADVVYEFPVEGSFTRFLAIYNKEDRVMSVGPVRSARDYFFHIVDEYDQALYLHSGGSPQALQYLRNVNAYPFFNGDEFAFSNSFTRSELHYAPHNLFTSSDQWKKLYKNFEKYITTTNTWSGWSFGKINTTSTSDISSIKIPYGIGNTVEWKYNKETKKYYKYKENKIVTDDSGQFIADNIVVQSHQISVIDNEGRLKISMIGVGSVRVIRDGKIIYGEWRKKDNNDRTRYYDENNNEINLKPGKTWVMIVPSSKKITVSS